MTDDWLRPEPGESVQWETHPRLKTALEQVQAFYDAGLTTEDSRVQSVSRSGTLGAAGAGRT